MSLMYVSHVRPSMIQKAERLQFIMGALIAMLFNFSEETTVEGRGTPYTNTKDYCMDIRELISTVV